MQRGSIKERAKRVLRCASIEGHSCPLRGQGLARCKFWTISFADSYDCYAIVLLRSRHERSECFAVQTSKVKDKGKDTLVRFADKDLLAFVHVSQIELGVLEGFSLYFLSLRATSKT